MAKSAVGGHCSCFPDSSVVLQLIFHEPDFAEKVSVFEISVSRLKIRTEILPRVNFEVTRKFMQASKDSVDVLRAISSSIANVSGKKLTDMPLDHNSLSLVEQAMQAVCGSIQGRGQTDRGQMIRRARIVETALITRAQEAIGSNSVSSFGQLIELVMEEVGNEYSKMCDALSAFMQKIGALHIKLQEIPAPSSFLKSMLGSIIKNSWDVEVLSQAICRMFHDNRWSAVVSFDFRDMVQNQKPIEEKSLLIVCDPLYLQSRLQQRIDLQNTPREEAIKRGIADSKFVENPSLMRVV